MKFLFICTKNSIFDIAWGLMELGHEVTVFEETVFDPLKPQGDQEEAFELALADHPYHYVISYLFIPSVADICQRHSLPYISWTYDSPLVSLFTDSVFHSTNYTFIFDQSECSRLQKMGVPHIYHLPLAVNTDRTGALDITPEDEKKYSHQISFVGGLYEQNTYNYIISSLPEKFQLELKLFIMQSMCHFEAERPWPVLSEECTAYLEQNFHAGAWNTTSLLSNAEYLGLLLLPRKLGEMERITLLNTLALDFPLDLYTKSSTDYLQNITIHKGVDYYTDMNKIFYLSKINLNITLPSIETGIPQRIFDIMGCGGFVLTNYQKEIEELFVIGKEIEVFHSVEELKEKCAYYLSHEKERLTIGINGYKRVRDNFSYLSQLKKMLTILQEESN